MTKNNAVLPEQIESNGQLMKAGDFATPPPNDMLIKIGFDIEFELTGPTPMVLMLFVHPSREGDLRGPQQLRVEPELPVSYYTDLFGNRCARLLAPPGNIRFA